MKDVQNERDVRNIPINKVGVSDLSYPIVVLNRLGQEQHTVAQIHMAVDLPHDFRGTHMSRFLEVVSRHSVHLKLDSLDKILKDMKATFESSTANLRVRFPYFMNKKAPVSEIESPMEYICHVDATMSSSDKLQLIVGVDVPVHNLCPCSKEISENGAHNQRGQVRVRLRASKLVWFEEIIAIAESAASAPLYSLLKREDEKFITELAYKNPRFVEDSARDVALALNSDPRVIAYDVEVENFESIHNHSAYAAIQKGDLDGRFGGEGMRSH